MLYRRRILDRTAFRDFFDRYAPAVHRRCLRLLGDREMAEDATQDVFTALLTKDRLDTLDKPLNYLYRSASNACIDRIRKRASTPIPLDLDFESP